MWHDLNTRTTSLRENGKHKSGGQKGHKGETLKQIETPDIVQKYSSNIF